MQYSQVVEIDPNLILVENRRRRDLGDVESLANDIAENGLINPILVTERDGRIVLVAGERRLEACKLLGLEAVPCRAVRGDGASALEVSENTRRKPFSILELGEAAMDLLSQARNVPPDRVAWAASRLGVSRYHMSRCLSVAEYVRRHPESRWEVEKEIASRGGVNRVLARARLESLASKSADRSSGPPSSNEVLLCVVEEKSELAVLPSVAPSSHRAIVAPVRLLDALRWHAAIERAMVGAGMRLSMVVGGKTVATVWDPPRDGEGGEPSERWVIGGLERFLARVVELALSETSTKQGEKPSVAVLATGPRAAGIAALVGGRMVEAPCADEPR